jgi:transposase-like protein
MQRRKFTREFKLEVARLIKDHSVSVAQASVDLGVHQSPLRDWVSAARQSRLFSKTSPYSSLNP